MRARAKAMAAEAPALDLQLRRLLWRCRRGMKELDVMLERCAAGGVGLTSGPARAAFEELLALPDPLLAGYLLGGNTPPQAHLAELVAAIRTYVAKQARAALF